MIQMQRLWFTQSLGFLEEALAGHGRGLERGTRKPRVVSRPRWGWLNPQACFSGAKNQLAKWVCRRARPTSRRGHRAPASIHKPFPRSTHEDRQCQKRPLTSGGLNPLFTDRKLRPERGGGRENEHSHSEASSRGHPHATPSAHSNPNERGFTDSVSQTGKPTCPTCRFHRFQPKVLWLQNQRLSHEPKQSEAQPDLQSPIRAPGPLCVRPHNRVPLPKAMLPSASGAALSLGPVSS